MLLALRCMPAGLRWWMGEELVTVGRRDGTQTGLRVCSALRCHVVRAGQHAGAAASAQLFNHAANIAT